MYTRILFTQDKTALAVVLGNNFNYSLIKRRLTMFYRKNTRFARMKSILVLPVAIGMVMIYSVGCRQSTDSIAPPPPPPPPPPPTEIPSAGDQIFTVVENMPQFPGGEDARVKYMAKNLLYPESAIKNQTEGTVYVSFVVEKDGSVNEVKILRGVGGEIDSEAFRVVKNMPKWSPGLQNGQAVRVQFTLPVKFKLSDNGKSGMINFGKDK
jgi:TonB family protein